MLEKVVRRRTLADGYLANRRLIWISLAFALFWCVQAATVIASMASHSAGFRPVELFILQGVATLPALLLFLTTAAAYCIQGGLLWLGRMGDLPWVSTVVSTISFLLHLTVLFLLTATLGFFAYSTFIMGDRTPLELTIGLSALQDWTPLLITLLVLLVCDIAIWLMLLISTVRRSLAALVSSFRKAPGQYCYSFSTIVVSSTGIEEEDHFLEDAMARARGYSARESEGIIEAGDRYLLRIASREEKLVAASIHERSDLTLVGVFPGVDEQELNLSILLEDSYHIQKERSKQPRGLLKLDARIADRAEQSGWKVQRGEALMELFHEEDLYTAR